MAAPMVRCEYCGRMSGPSTPGGTFCRACREKFRDARCSICGVELKHLPPPPMGEICGPCERREWLSKLQGEERTAILRPLQAGQRIPGIREIRRVLDLNLADAVAVADELWPGD